MCVRLPARQRLDRQMPDMQGARAVPDGAL